MRWGWAMVVALGCTTPKPHVRLPAPPPNMTPEQRLQAFNALRPRTETLEITTVCRGTACSTSHKVSMRIANGTEIWYAADLEPIIPPNSDTSRAIVRVHAAERAYDTSNALYIGGAGGAMVGVLLLSSSSGDGDLLAALMITSGLVVALVGGIGRSQADKDIARATSEAFADYDLALAARFNICVSALAIVPCEAESPPTPAPAPEPEPKLPATSVPDRTALRMRR